MLGRYYEDFTVGDTYHHPLGRTISEADNTWFTLLTLNTNQSHFNADYAAGTPYKKLLVNSTLTVAIVTGISVPDVSQHAFANLGWEEIKMPNPVFVGDTIYARSTVLDLRESKSRPYAGIVKVFTTGFNQDGVDVITWTRTMLTYKRGHGPSSAP
ncbi:acyl dehydratase [Actinoplanes lutulentus]|uniref:Acyl dehydratase n=1 Tax=Actinoplanes lutulentus TaxID=1287878 RepID=A0A327ZI56_9ACTN|nr:MaoC family dehydratase [Actinoplanes lutulentus]MBB2944389.1 acyl dehydratase [Actinoplanes lutulentus]RAK42379.1 acyl dehydratase [Actinoplanes lutulentus]